MKKYIKTRDGEKVKLVGGKISYSDRTKVIPGISDVYKLRQELKKLKSVKIKL